ncbi:MAG TPA: tRNA epoxyqueuosine(34) reductase QueG [Polyangiaceae bacterium]|nr:tRNA epoxyqueuosine(34) reductase QueG [Polyangiaceae bacterium]
MAPGSVSFSDQVRSAARRLGFDAVGIARASGSIGRDFAHYEAFIGAGMHGEMAWLARNVDVRERLDGDGILRGARSVICVARRYPAGSEPSAPAHAAAEPVQTIARYARGRDYHAFVRRRLRKLAAFVRSLGTPDEPVRARPLLDEHPVLERAWAARAGLGFVGKNGMLIVPGIGSMALLGEVVTTLALDVDAPIAERCGACTRCLEACPTRAFVRPFVLDARRCVSYLTIEHRTSIPPELREGIGAHLFGCDDCQTVCPFNAGAGARAPLEPARGEPFAPLERWSRVRLESLLSLDEAGWNEISAGSPLRRAGRVGIARNAAIVLGNRRDVAALAALRAAARDHDDAIVREAASWAVSRIAGAAG